MGAGRCADHPGVRAPAAGSPAAGRARRGLLPRGPHPSSSRACRPLGGPGCPGQLYRVRPPGAGRSAPRRCHGDVGADGDSARRRYRDVFPVPRAAARQTLLGEGHEEDFIVLNANRNQPRKRIDTTVRAFARFAQGKPESVRLHLHMGLHDRGWDLRALVRRNGLEDRVIYTTDDTTMPFVSDESLRLIYSAADVGVNTATTEGWGLVAFEHAATGAAQILPGHSVFKELWTGAAHLVPERLTLDTPDGLFNEHYVSPADVADAFERLYTDAAYRDYLSTAARERATQLSYSWDSIARQWQALLEAVLSLPDRKSWGMRQ
ncbi:glycosyltransferase [Tahibacter amnicola]|uniref:Glycosyltransferase n=1 Tax=Tahibacter amnicola TaxID=2976241 RepID=A0ABY6BKN1_9GAMM|nr:glycosyltransferase [Tahibacter amnicola]UXI70578.1 glycosyltransferase [Tahibacter amnicola]